MNLSGMVYNEPLYTTKGYYNNNCFENKTLKVLALIQLTICKCLYFSGRRVCLGEQLARQELFIFTVILLQNLTFSAEDPKSPPPLEGYQGLTLTPNAYKLIAS